VCEYVTVQSQFHMRNSTVMDRVNAGESFSDQARELSTCPSKDKGGELIQTLIIMHDVSAWLCKLIRHQRY
jgi:hypothetical protein